MSLYTESKPSVEFEVSREVMLANLITIADSEHSPTSLEELDVFVINYGVMRAFEGTINGIGEEHTWFGQLLTGTNTLNGRFVSATFLKSQRREGFSHLHVYAREGQHPSFGVVLPFNPDGSLDKDRSISASSFLTDHQVSAFIPKEHIESTRDYEKLAIKPLTELEPTRAAKVIGEVIQMAAATLVSLLELEDVSAKPANPIPAN